MIAWLKRLWYRWTLKKRALPPLDVIQPPREYVTRPVPPPEMIRPPPLAVGGCGVTGCPNRRPHSHVMALAERLRKDKR